MVLLNYISNKVKVFLFDMKFYSFDPPPFRLVRCQCPILSALDASSTTINCGSLSKSHFWLFMQIYFIRFFSVSTHEI